MPPVEPAPQRPRYIRLPPDGELCPWSKLSRGKLRQLIDPVEGKPFVASVTVPNQLRNKRGARLIVLDSLLGYLEKLEKEAETRCA